MPQIIAERLQKLQTLSLKHGAHRPDSTFCVMEAVAWVAGEGQLKIEFDPHRSPFVSNIFQAPAGMRLLSGTPRAGTKPGSFRYRLWLNDQLIGSGEIILREK